MKNQNFCLNLWTDNKINSAFVKANMALLNKYSENLGLASDKDYQLRYLWLREYDVELLETQGQITALKFKSQQHQTMFLIKWS